MLQTKRDATVHDSGNQTARDARVVSGRVGLDPWGRAVRSYYPSVEELGANPLVLRTALDPMYTGNRYDILDRTTETILPDDPAVPLSERLRQSQVYSLEQLDGLTRQRTRITDPKGKVKDLYADQRGLIVAMRENDGRRDLWTRYTYDPLKQISTIADAEGNTTRVLYDMRGAIRSYRSPDSGETRFVFDAAGNLTRKITANLAARGMAIEYDYDYDQLVAIRYPEFPSANVRYEWGSASRRGDGARVVGRIARVEDASGSEQREYGPLGEVVVEKKTIASKTLGNGGPQSPEVWTTRYSYDSFNRLRQIVYPDTEVVTYSYDSGGMPHRVEGFKLGAKFPYVNRLEYDRFGERAFQELGNGVTTTYTYESEQRRLSRVVTQNDEREFQDLRFSYDAVSNITSVENDVQHVRPPEYGGPVQQTFEYDDLHRLTGAEGSWQYAPGKDDHYQASFAYDGLHNITHKRQQHWVRGRGEKDIPQKKTTFDYAYTYGGRPHAATRIGEREFSYDPNGNLVRWDDTTSGQRRTLLWDEENRLRAVADNGRTTEYVYDHDGRRVIKRGKQGETAYVNDLWTARNRSIGTKHIFVGPTRAASKLSPGEAHVDPTEHDQLALMLGRWFEVRSETANENAQNICKNPHYQAYAQYFERCNSQPDSNFLYFYHPDHLGSTSYVTDGAGELYEHMQYFPSGELWVQQHSNTQRTPYLFSSKELEEETGLYDFGARYYDPRTSAWLSVDPAGVEYLPNPDDTLGQLPAGGVYASVNLNGYAYAGANPIKYTDPNGRSFVAALFIFGGAILAQWIEPATANSKAPGQPNNPGLDEGGKISRDLGGAVAGYGLARLFSSPDDPGPRYQEQEQQQQQAPGDDASKGGTYKLRDPETGQVRRTGRTNDLKRRQGEHGRNAETKDLEFEVDRRTDSYAAQRGREQRIYDQHPEADLNRKKPISDRNPRREEYLREGDKL